MATRFYFRGTDSPAVSPAFDSGWEVTTDGLHRQLVRSNFVKQNTPTANSTLANTPNTTTQDVLSCQWVSDSILAQTISGTVSLVMRCVENVATVNATLACVIRVVSLDGNTVRGTLFSNFSQDTEFDIAGATSTRIINVQSVTPVVCQDEDRIVVEIGGHLAAPSTTGTIQFFIGTDAGADYALTSGLTTVLNPWIEFSQDIFTDTNIGNYPPYVRVGNGNSRSERAT